MLSNLALEDDPGLTGTDTAFRSVCALIRARAAADPGRIAAADPAGALTYAELERRAGRLAARLRAAEVAPGACVGVFLDRSPEFVVAACGILWAGAAYLPVDTTSPLIASGSSSPTRTSRRRDVRASPATAARFDAFWRELVAQNPDRLLGIRDAAALRWHYGVPLRAGRLWVVAALRNGLIRAYCVLKQHHRLPGVRSMKIVDFQTVEPDTDLLPGLVKPALRRAAAQDCAFLEHHGCGLPRMRWFETIVNVKVQDMLDATGSRHP